MRSKNYIGCFAIILIVAVVLIASMLITKTIVEADIPLWLKFFLFY